MALRKAVGAEAFQLREGLFGELGRISVLDHAGHQFVLEARDATSELEGRHRFAQLVCLAAREAGTDHRNAHGAFLKQRHAQRFAEHRLQLGCRILDRLLAFAPAKIGMHHIALNWARSDDRHLHDEIVEGARF